MLRKDNTLGLALPGGKMMPLIPLMGLPLALSVAGNSLGLFHPTGLGGQVEPPPYLPNIN
jgi:hypothetical protein